MCHWVNLFFFFFMLMFSFFYGLFLFNFLLTFVLDWLPFFYSTRILLLFCNVIPEPQARSQPSLLDIVNNLSFLRIPCIVRRSEYISGRDSGWLREVLVRMKVSIIEVLTRPSSKPGMSSPPLILYFFDLIILTTPHHLSILIFDKVFLTNIVNLSKRSSLG